MMFESLRHYRFLPLKMFTNNNIVVEHIINCLDPGNTILNRTSMSLNSKGNLKPVACVKISYEQK